MMGGLLVFSLPGCGGGYLAEVLDAHPRLRCFREPFNPAVPDPTGRRTTSPTLAQMDAVLHGIWAEWPVILHVWDPSGWPFPQHSPHNGHVLLSASRVVLLARRSLLRLAVAQTAAARPERAAGAPLDVTRVRRHLEQLRPTLRTHRRVLYTRDRPMLDLAWDEFAAPGLDARTRTDAVERVCAFFGASLHDEGVDSGRIRRALDAPDDHDSVGDVPNLEEIEAAFPEGEAEA